MKWLPLVALVACGQAEAPMLVSLELPLAKTDIKSFEMFVATVEATGLTKGEDACTRFFSDDLKTFDTVASTTFAFDGTSAPPDLKVSPGQHYVVFFQGWNVDIGKTPDDPTRKVLALGCQPDVPVLGSRTTTLSVPICLIQPAPAPLLCPPVK